MAATPIMPMGPMVAPAPAPVAVAGVDTNRDGRANIVVMGSDRNRDGIPDVLQASGPPVAGTLPAAAPPVVGQLPPVMAQVISATPVSVEDRGEGSAQVYAANSSRFPAPGMVRAPQVLQPGSYSVPVPKPAPVYAANPSVVYREAPAYQPMPAPTAQTLSYVPPTPMSYTPAPQYAQGPYVAGGPVSSFVAQPPPGPAPVEGTLTRGMPDPKAVDQQRNVYARALETELQKSIQAIQEKNAMEKKMLAQAAQQQKQMYELQVDQVVQGQAAMLDEQRNMQLLGLQQEAMNQKIGLENQAAGLKLEYEQRKAQEEMMFKQYELQKVAYETERKLAKQQADFSQMQAAAAQPAQAGVPPPGALFALPTGELYYPGQLPQVPAGMMMVPQASMGQLPPQPYAPQMIVEQVASPGYVSAQPYQAPVTYLQQTPSYVGPVTQAN